MTWWTIFLLLPTIAILAAITIAIWGIRKNRKKAGK